MSLFNQTQGQPVSMPRRWASRYATARINLLWVVLFTVINIVLLVINNNTYFLFSASIPYVLVDLGMFLCGKYPDEVYGDPSLYYFFDNWVLVVAVALAALICISYLLCWLLSKKGKVGWLIAALVLFVLDTVSMFLMGVATDNMVNVVLHGWVIVSLTLGIVGYFKLKKLPVEEPVVTQAPVEELEAVQLPEEEAAPVELPQE